MASRTMTGRFSAAERYLRIVYFCLPCLLCARHAIAFCCTAVATLFETMRNRHRLFIVAAHFPFEFVHVLASD